MEIVSINSGKDTLLKCPKPPIYLSDNAKKYYLQMGNLLARLDKLKPIYLNALEIYADSMDQYQWAVISIKNQNKEKNGSGYIQVFKTGAKNISVELSIKNDAISKLIKCFSLFGLDPKSEKDLKETSDPNQISLFAELMQSKAN